jgi:hypothetical protein
MAQAVITEELPRCPPYQCHRPEQTHLYQIVNQHYSEFRDVMAAQGKPLPMHVQQGFSEYLSVASWRGRLDLRASERKTAR